MQRDVASTYTAAAAVLLCMLVAAVVFNHVVYLVVSCVRVRGYMNVQVLLVVLMLYDHVPVGNNAPSSRLKKGIGKETR